MGGSAFASGERSLDTPRMRPQIYEHVKAKCTAALRDLYMCVASPIEGPEKEDFGDVDILVTWEKAAFQAEFSRKHAPEATIKNTNLKKQEFNDDEDGGFDYEEGQERSPCHSLVSRDEARQAIRTALGAEYTIFNRVGDHYAIPWPNSDSEVETKETSKRYIQVDITVCDSLQQMQWLLFKHAHGDLWIILGSIIKPYGLTADGHALFLRNPDIEKFEKYKSMGKICLTRDPAEILLFLGLDVARYSEPFATRQEMYEYAASCRLFRIWSDPDHENSGRLESSVSSPISTGIASPSTAPDSAGSPMSPVPGFGEIPESKPRNEESEPVRKKLKAKERKSLKSRPAFRQWYDEFVPRCREEGRFFGETVTWLDVTEEAFERFCIRSWYKRVHLDVVRCRSEDRVLADVLDKIDDLVPADRTDTKRCQFRGGLRKALKSIIFQGDESYGVVPERELRDGSGFMIKDEVDKFVSQKWREIGNAAMDRNQQRYEEHCREKEKKQWR